MVNILLIMVTTIVFMMVNDGSRIIINIWLVVQCTYPSDKYEFVSWDDEIPNIWKHKKCSKPPTKYQLFTSIPQEKGILMKIVLAEVSIESTFTDCGLLHTYKRHKWDTSRKFKGHNAAVIYPVPVPKVDQWIQFLVSDLWMGRI